MMKLDSEDAESLVVLNATSGLNAKVLQAFLNVFQSPAALVSAQVLCELKEMGGTGARLASNIESAKARLNPEREIEAIAKAGASLIDFHDSEYPPLLREISDPPLLLYKQGPARLEATSFLGIVGSRNASFYGRETAEKFAFILSENGIGVASGLARGIDAAAHLGALKAGGVTVAVIGSGLDVIYPRENEALFEKLRQEGAIISEFPFGTRPLAHHFPKRNRIIAGMAKGVLVVEASLRSGSLITSRLAAEEGREVYSIPGKIDYFGARGSNGLIKQGARLIDSVEEILNDFQVSKISSSTETQGVACGNSPAALTADELELLEMIPRSGIGMEELLSLWGREAGAFQVQLMKLELKTRIKIIDGKIKLSGR